MALAAYVNAGTAASAVQGTGGNITPALPASLVDGNLLVVQVTSRDNQTHSLPAGWTQKFQASNTATTQVSVWYARYRASAPNAANGEVNAAPLVTHSGTGAIVARVSQWSGVITYAQSADPFGAFSAAISATGTSVSTAGIVTATDQELPIHWVGAGTANTANAFSAVSGIATAPTSVASNSASNASGRACQGFWYGAIVSTHGTTTSTAAATCSAAPLTTNGWSGLQGTLKSRPEAVGATVSGTGSAVLVAAGSVTLSVSAIGAGADVSTVSQITYQPAYAGSASATASTSLQSSATAAASGSVVLQAAPSAGSATGATSVSIQGSGSAGATSSLTVSAGLEATSVGSVSLAQILTTDATASVSMRDQITGAASASASLQGELTASATGSVHLLAGNTLSVRAIGPGADVSSPTEVVYTSTEHTATGTASVSLVASATASATASAVLSLGTVSRTLSVKAIGPGADISAATDVTYTEQFAQIATAQASLVVAATLTAQAVASHALQETRTASATGSAVVFAPLQSATSAASASISGELSASATGSVGIAGLGILTVSSPTEMQLVTLPVHVIGIAGIAGVTVRVTIRETGQSYTATADPSTGAFDVVVTGV